MPKEKLVKLFEAPGAQWRAKPFWSWNGELEEAELLRQVGVIKEMGWGGHFMHSRSGLITEYLGEEWFRLINSVTDETERLGMESWLYDEDRWPSGSAGGKVTVDPQYRMKSLMLTEMPCESYVPDEEALGVWLGWVDGYNLWYSVPLTEKDDIEALKAGFTTKKTGGWRVLQFTVCPDACDSSYNGTTYIDTMSEKATRRFIQLTHEEYKKHCGKRLGTSIKGIFTDEPHRGHGMDNLREDHGVRTCQMAWTDDLFEEFEKRYGYDARPLLPALFYAENGERVAKVKLNYFDLADNLFLERFAKPLNDWCNENGILFTGHVLHEDSLSNQTVPQGSLMRFYEYMGIPGVDVLTEGNRDYWVVKQLASAARQLGKDWMLSELYGCTGWQMDFRAHKAVGDWQTLFGINLRCPHLSWYTMEGQSKRDYPASLLSQSPWYRDYSLVESYFARFGVLMSQAQPLCNVLVLNPIESVWCQTYLGWAKWIENADPEIEKLEKAYVEMFSALTQGHIDFDYGEEQMMSAHAAVEKEPDGTPVLRVGKMRYRTVVVGGMVTIRPSTLALLNEFAAAGGSIIFAGDAPAFVDAVPDTAPAALATQCIHVPFEASAVTQAVQEAGSCCVQITGADGTNADDVFVQQRIHADAGVTVVALLNTDREALRDGLTVSLAAPKAVQVQEWDAVTGKRYLADDAVLSNGKLTLHTALEAGGTRFFVLAQQAEQLPVHTVCTVISSRPLPQGSFAFHRDEPNVGVLDFARWRWEGGEWHTPGEVLKVDQAIRDDLGIERRGGGMLQPWYSKLHHTEHYGMLELEYAFEIETLPDAPVWLAAERPENMQYSLNGVALSCPDSSDFWVDICFKKLPVPAEALKSGRNIITVQTDFTRNTNVEALYLLGDFGVQAEGHRCILTALPKTIGFGNLAQYGMPFYTGCLDYTITPQQYAGLMPKAGQRILLSPTHFTGALVRVTAGDKLTRLGWEPFEADVTEAVQQGLPITVTLVGTRRNTFGPLHLVPAYDIAYGPDHFVSEGEHWSDDYVMIGSGLDGIELMLCSAPQADKGE